jgi:hypothetical protein
MITEQDSFRAFLTEVRWEASSRGRVARRVLLLGTGATPCQGGVRELLRLGLDWIPIAWLRLYEEHTGDTSIVLADLMPVVIEPKVTAQVKARAPKYTYRESHEPYVGVVKIEQLRRTRYIAAKKYVPFRVTRRIPKGHFELFDSAEAAASAFDSMIRSRGRGGRLNFRTALDEPTFTLKEAA